MDHGFTICLVMSPMSNFKSNNGDSTHSYVSLPEGRFDGSEIMVPDGSCQVVP